MFDAHILGTTENSSEWCNPAGRAWQVGGTDQS